ncbi:HET-domain-containing protein [Phaeosphaeriaceae sp. SRC1lsM3a]|nr:HET-domain-containing protein [Stagonospora sp. SRC1lsM3a]
MLRNELSWKLGIELSPYDRSKSESYSNKYDLRSKAKHCGRTAFRFLVHSRTAIQSRPEASGIIQYLAHKEKNPLDRQFFGRKVNRNQLDTELLRTWLRTCSKWHGGICDRNIAAVDSQALNLRLIDVERHAVVSIHNHNIPEYVALSYVWGRQRMMEETGMEPALLLRKNIRHDEKGNEFTPLPTSLPKTVADAMALSQTLGYRYLWNDALCIIQDNPAPIKDKDLNSMKLIYSLSSLTIAVAAGTHADYGIPGASVPRKFPQYSEIVQGLRLATMFPSFTALENSTSLLWNTRGWAFQEKLLSRKLLLLTDYQAYFRCAESIWTEEINLETGQLSKSVEARRAKYLWDPGRIRHKPVATPNRNFKGLVNLNTEDEWDYIGGFLDYTAAVAEYSKRDLTDRGDIFPAISGVLDTLRGQLGDFILGLPQKFFLESLLWFPEPGCIHVRETSQHLPSWTWAGWLFTQGSASFDPLDVRQLRRLIEGSSQLYHGRDERHPAEKESGMHSVFLAATLRRTYGNIISCLETIRGGPHTVKTIYCVRSHRIKRVEFEPPESALNFRSKVDIGAILNLFGRQERQDWHPSSKDLRYHDDLLIFKSSVVRFRIGKNLQIQKVFGNDPGNDQSGVFAIKNRQGQIVGEVFTTNRHASSSNAHRDFLSISWGFALRYASIHPAWVPRWTHDGEGLKANNPSATEEEKDVAGNLLMILGMATGSGMFNPLFRGLQQLVEPYAPGRWLSATDKPGGDPLDPATRLFNDLQAARKGKPMSRYLWPIVNVMLVEWDGKIARRVGVGKIIMQAWQDQATTPREVALG